ncbi:MAG: hypothetical protein ACTSUE_05395 [Promethearchaeota archaeon]
MTRDSIFARVGRAIGNFSGPPTLTPRSGFSSLKAVPESTERPFVNEDDLIDAECTFCDNDASGRCKTCGRPACTKHLNFNGECPECVNKTFSKKKFKNQNVRSFIMCVVFMIISILLSVIPWE